VEGQASMLQAGTLCGPRPRSSNLREAPENAPTDVVPDGDAESTAMERLFLQGLTLVPACVWKMLLPVGRGLTAV
jgi:hypothetical protein